VSREQLQRDHLSATQAFGWFTLPGWDTLLVTGADRASFLHNMCTNDIKGLAPGEGCEAFFTDVKGRIVAHAFVLAGEQAVELLLVPGLAARLVAHLDRYIIREDVQLRDVSSNSAWVALIGREALSAALGQVARPLEPGKPWAHAEVELASPGGATCRIVRCDLLWPGGALLCVDRAQSASARGTQRIQGHESLEVSADLWHAIRIESVWPLFGVDFDESSLPQEVNRDHLAIHFRKGCYLGQETVARIDALGHVNKKLVQVRFSGDVVPEVGATLTSSGQEAGRVTSAVWSPRFRSPLTLAMVRRGFNAPGTPLETNGISAEVLPAVGVEAAG
jgi:tRNA-modifying protein YgfZ